MPRIECRGGQEDETTLLYQKSGSTRHFLNLRFCKLIITYATINIISTVITWEQFVQTFRNLINLFLFLLLKLKSRLSPPRLKPRLWIYQDDVMGHYITAFDSYESDIMIEALALISKFIEPSDSAIDCGANIGNHSIHFFADKFKKVYAFEPNPDVFTILKLNSKHYPNIQPIPLAVSNVAESNTLTIIPHHIGASRIDSADHSANTISITTTTLTDFFAKSSDRIALIKIDIEGHEEQAIDGAIDVITKHRPVIFFEAAGTNNAALKIESLRYQLLIPNGLAKYQSSFFPKMLSYLTSVFIPQKIKFQRIRAKDFTDIYYPLVVAIPDQLT